MHEAFHVEIYFKLKPIEYKIIYLFYIFQNLIVLIVKSAKFQLFYAFLSKKIKNVDRIAMVTVTQAM